jgi:hypothetical protein
MTGGLAANQIEGEKEMQTATHNQTQKAITEQETVAERRLWMAVIVGAVEDWRGGTLRARREAEKFLFEDDGDFKRVCDCAGLEATSFRAGLLRIGKRVAHEDAWWKTFAA